MFQNFIKTCFRNIRKQKGFSFINIAGLSLGLAACLLIGLFVRDEKQYDRFIPGSENIYRVYQQAEDDVNNIIATAPPMFATALKQNFPEVEKTVRVVKINARELFEVNNKKFYEEGGFIADSNFFELFPLHFRYGSPLKSLDNPNSIIISEAMALKYFGNESPVGKNINLDESVLRINGVLKNDQKFHLPINYLISFAGAGYQGEIMESWQWYPFNTYVKLKEGSSVSGIEKKFQTYSKPFLKGEGGINIPIFQPLSQIHLHSSDFKYDMSTRGNIIYVRALTIIAIFILLIACFNFVNLATSKSLQRAKEVGIRKTIGANRKQLIIQFIGETVLLAFIGMAIAVAITYLLLPSLNQFTEKQITIDLLSNPLLLLLLLLVTVIVGVLAGFYPALVLSGFQPIKVLKGR